MKLVILLVYFYNIGLIVGDTEISEIDEISEISETGDTGLINDVLYSTKNAIKGTLHKTVKRYFCTTGNRNDTELLVYGSREWTFPAQDVTLHLDYPTKNDSNSLKYLLTEVLVIVHLEGTRSKGFITSGGMMRDHISMKFVFSNITRVSYQLYLYGVPSDLNNLNSIYNIC